MIRSLAWRNVKRSRRRSVITAILSIMTTTLFIFYVSMMDGSYGKIFKDSVEIYPGYIQVTHKDYRDEPSNDHLIFNAKAIVEKLKDRKDIEYVAQRFESFALYATDENSIGGLFTGIEPEIEPKLSRVSQTIKEGRYLLSTDKQEVIIGQGLATRLKLKLGDTFSMIGSGADYSFTADNLKAVGIFKTGLIDFDNSAVFMNKTYFDELMTTEGASSHIIIKPVKTEKSLELAATLNTAFSDQDEVEVQDWHEYLSSIIEAMQIDRVSGMITLWVLIALIFFVVMIYAYLAIYSRTKEVGIMRAIGTSPKQIIMVLVTETLIVAGISILIGAVLGGWISYYYQIHPIEIPGLEETYQQYGIIEAVLPTDFRWSTILEGCGFILMLNLISVLYPIWQIIRIKPIDAIHHL